MLQASQVFQRQAGIACCLCKHSKRAHVAPKRSSTQGGGEGGMLFIKAQLVEQRGSARRSSGQHDREHVSPAELCGLEERGWQNALWLITRARAVAYGCRRLTQQGQQKAQRSWAVLLHGEVKDILVVVVPGAGAALRHAGAKHHRRA